MTHYSTTDEKGKLSIDELSARGVDAFLTEDAWESFGKRYHFGAEDMPHIRGVFEAMKGLLTPEVCYAVAETPVRYLTTRRFLVCAVTLGDAPDSLQELYLTRAAVGDAYVVESLGSFVLENMYRMLPERLHARTGLWMRGMEFSEDRAELAEQLALLEETDCAVTLTEYGMLLPKASVVFTSALTKEKPACPQTVCAGCPRTDCPTRHPAA